MLPNKQTDNLIAKGANSGRVPRAIKFHCYFIKKNASYVYERRGLGNKTFVQLC